MKSALASFMQEVSTAAGSPRDTPEVKEHEQRDDNSKELSSGILLMAGCVDWDNATAKTAQGLDEPHRIQCSSKNSSDLSVRCAYSSSSSQHAVFWMSDGSLQAVGKNDKGQLGTGDELTQAMPVPIAVPFPMARKIMKVSTGKSHTLVLVDTGEVFGCGANNFGQLGFGEGKALTTRNHTKLQIIPSLSRVTDIACGHDFSVVCDMSGVCFSFGHPEYGQLGHGFDGQFMQEGRKGIQFACVYNPRRVPLFVTKDAHGKVTAKVPSYDIKIRSIAAGRNHVVCIEEWEQGDGSNSGSSSSSDESRGVQHLNRVYSWGFGGYGRLGHNCSNDEFLPREITSFSHYVHGTGEQIPPLSAQRQIRSVVAGSTYTLGISQSRHLYFWGKLSNSARGEANVYPQMVQELYDYPVTQCAGGSNFIVALAEIPPPRRPPSQSTSASASSSLASSSTTEGSAGAAHEMVVPAKTCCIAWGQPVAGKFGLEGGARSSVNPKFVAAVDVLRVLDVSCGYGHMSFVAAQPTSTDNTDIAGKSSSGAGSGSSNADQRKLLDALPCLERTPPAAAQNKDKGKGKGRSEGQSSGAGNQKRTVGPAAKKSRKR